MMEFRTKIPLEAQAHHLIDYHSNLLLLGSCFAENIGEKLSYFKFQSAINPFGILFHPLAIEHLIANAINEKEYDQDSIFELNELWHCFDAHSKLSNHSKEALLKELNTSIKTTRQSIIEASHIIITLGTAWMYRHIESDQIVANCHKVPQKKFLKELLSVDCVSESLQAIVSLIKSVNPKTAILFTVSPVRHLKDGFIENNNSKAHLLAAVHNVVEPRQAIFYFPSYEIQMDELRDYRFYSEDMVHPNKAAIDYIWQRFAEVWISQGSKSMMQEVDSIQKGLQHKAFHPESNRYLKFLTELESRKTKVSEQFPHMTF